MTYVIPSPFACLPTGPNGVDAVLPDTDYSLAITQDRVTELFTVKSGVPTNPIAIAKSLVKKINETAEVISVEASRVGGMVRVTGTRAGSYVGVVSPTTNFEFIYEEEAYDNLLTQFQDNAKIRSLLGLFTDQQKDVEKAFFELLQLRTIDLAPTDTIVIDPDTHEYISGGLTSAVLDTYGEIVARKRNGVLNVKYKESLQQKIEQNASHGTAQDILEAAEIIVGWGENISLHPDFKLILQEVFPAAVRLTVVDGNFKTVSGTAESIKKCAAAGVEFTLVNVPTGVFGFESSHGAAPSSFPITMLGFGSTYEPTDEQEGGIYATQA